MFFQLILLTKKEGGVGGIDDHLHTYRISNPILSLLVNMCLNITFSHANKISNNSFSACKYVCLNITFSHANRISEPILSLLLIIYV